MTQDAANESWSAPAIPMSVPRLRSEAIGFATTCDVIEPPINDLKLALSEAITNAVVHGFRGREPGTVTVTMTVDTARREVLAVVLDDGIGCRPRADSPGLGLGLPLISTLAQNVEVRTPTSGVGTEVCMCFALGQPATLG
jgi:serine/threonine-protein kinase RsbW/stage II sporulation protein AB (anti-sigma F factor)